MAIIVLHAFTMYSMYYKDTAKTSSYILSNVIVYMMMWAVPCFVMVTGALLLDPDKEIPLKKLYGRYILRIAVVLVVFTFIFTLCDAIYDAVHDDVAISAIDVVKDALLKLYRGGGWSHLWYLYLLLGLYALLPAFRGVVKGLDAKALIYIMVIYAVFNSVLPMLNKLTETKTGFYITTNSIFPFYLIMGYIIHKDIIRLDMVKSVMLFLIGQVAIVVLTIYGINAPNQDIIALLGNYSFVPVVISGIGAFGIFISVNIKKPSKLILNIDKLSFGIYITHLAFLRYAVRLELIDPYTHGGNITILGIAVVAFLAALILTALLRLIPGVKRYL